MPPGTPIGTQLINKPLFSPTFANVDYFFNKVLMFFDWVHGLNGASPIYLTSYVISLFGITMIIYAVVRLIEIYKEEHGHLRHDIETYQQRKNERESGTRNERWEHIQELVASPNTSDWRLAIIEADTVLEGLLAARDIPGNSIGERLKNMSPGDLGSIQAAWEAHLVRNRIAHEGSDFELSNRDARRTIQLYEVVFQELGFV